MHLEVRNPRICFLIIVFKCIALKLNETNSSAEINIPPTSVCGLGYKASRNDDSYEYYDYPKICRGLPSCNEFKNGVTYTCYDMYTLFGECSKRIVIPSSKISDT